MKRLRTHEAVNEGTPQQASDQVPDNLALISGEIHGLQWWNGREAFLNTQSDQQMARAGSLLAAAAGEMFTAGNLSLASSDDGAFEMQYFSGKLGDRPVVGRFYEPDFKDGDFLELVAAPNGGVYEALAVRRPSDRVMWLLPEHSAGHVAHRRKMVRYGWLSSGALLAFFFGMLSYVIHETGGMTPGLRRWLTNDYMEVLLTLMMIIAGTYWLCYRFFVVTLLSRTSRYAYMTTGILRSFGYERPEQVDVAKASRQLIKQDLQAGKRWDYSKLFVYRY
ncbi:hypothetical protein OOT46_02485 [Aquabacterium sp. A7-Y]|uniref:putative type VI secretion system effector n=1 Tax=Aquabacterium sp. A7-Y TaxID=1349605 RepID=UPI00223E754A|nr:putative type VI secretion system effector [Aquabacterium sp. A7-Y]MCW7536721.1 hypothetical protein [Aquabacterium sp. A7-Y]